LTIIHIVDCALCSASFGKHIRLGPLPCESTFQGIFYCYVW